jgi:serine/threonine protein kinase
MPKGTSGAERLAEFELVVNYRTLPSKIGLYLMGATMPIWSVIVPFCLGLFITMCITPENAGRINPFVELGLILAMTAIPVTAIFLTAICEDDRILISKEGIAFPLSMLARLGFRRDRLWTDLTAAQIFLGQSESTKKGVPQGNLSMYFRSGGQVSLSLPLMSKPVLEQLLLAVEIWGNNCERTPQLIEYQNSLQNESRGLDKFSYTQMWEEELSRRFSATSFVPLEPDHRLKDKSLRIVRQLAFGGLSAIYLAQRDEKDIVVIKEAVVPASADEQSRAKASEHFEREAQLLITLDNPNIAKVYDHFADDGRNYLVLQYISGQDLRQLIRQHGPQPQELVLMWFLRLANILDYLHNRIPPIIHRDLTPDNIVRREDNDIVLIDFGAANEFVGTATGTLVGKQSYIAPEQLRGKATTSSDIYALGGTVHFLLTGKDPEALSPSHPRELVPEISPELDQLVFRCTQMEAEDRPASPAELCQLIEQLIDKLVPLPMLSSDATAASAGSQQ